MTTILSPTSAATTGLNNYGDLKDAVARWLNRTNLTDDIPVFVRLAETTIRRDVRVRVQEEFEAGTGDADTLDTPDLLLEARRLVVGGKVFGYCPPEEFQDLQTVSSTAQRFTIIGESIYALGGFTGIDYSLLYWKAFVPFEQDSDTNWLLLNAPEIYLWSSCKEGAEFLKDFEAADRFEGKYQSALALLNASERAMRHSGSTLVVRPRGSTP